MATLFISDLHLEPSRPEVAKTLLGFLQQQALKADALYILGDLFEAWIGDDFDNIFIQQLKISLKAISSAGVPLYFMHGNRDFLIGERFAQETGCRILPDPSLVELYGRRALLMHGDTLCTKDLEYLELRKMVRNPAWQAQLLSKPIPERLALAQQLRDISKEKTSAKGAEIMDVTPEEVERVMREQQVDLLIHGHTHRPAVHDFELDGRPATRIVLGDWYQKAWMLRFSAEGFELLDFPFAD